MSWNLREGIIQVFIWFFLPNYIFFEECGVFFSMTDEVIQSSIQRKSQMTVTCVKKVTRQPLTCKMKMLLTEGYNKLFANWKFLRFIFCISNSYFFECCLIIIMRRRMRGWRSRKRRRRTGTRSIQTMKRYFPLLAHDRGPTQSPISGLHLTLCDMINTFSTCQTHRWSIKNLQLLRIID